MPETGAATIDPDKRAAADAVMVAPGIDNPDGKVVLMEGTPEPLLINTELF